MNRRILTLAFLLLFGVSLAFGQGNGKLQIHYVDVGQGDGAVLISPEGQVVLFDHGVLNECDRPVAYLQGLGITQIDYMITSHYHSDHIGCTQQILERFPLQGDAIDRGGAYPSSTFNRYVAEVGSHRVTGVPGMTITLGAPPNLVEIEVLAVNADGMETTDENSLSLVTQIRYGDFRAEIGGDLTGSNSGGGVDVESVVAPRVGPLDVYKAHHHCSRYSNNENWLGITSPTVTVLSMGDHNTYGHPHSECLDRLHNAGTITYWTTFGSDRSPAPLPGLDNAAGTIVVETGLPVEGPQTYSVQIDGVACDTYAVRTR